MPDLNFSAVTFRRALAGAAVAGTSVGLMAGIANTDKPIGSVAAIPINSLGAGLYGGIGAGLCLGLPAGVGFMCLQEMDYVATVGTPILKTCAIASVAGATLAASAMATSELKSRAEVK